jgi:hypothetical protein
MSKDLLKEAIADAKAVRETAIANAKLALEEAFTPKLQSMLSAKLQEDDMEDEEEDVDVAEMEHGEEEAEEGMHADDETEEGMHGDDEAEEGMREEDEEEEEGMREEDEEEAEEGMREEDEEEDDLDLESIIRELEGEDEDEAEEGMREASDSSDIGKGDNKMDQAGNDTEDPGKGKLKEEEEGDDEEIDLDEVIRSLTEEDEDEEEMEEEEDKDAELEEAYNTIRSLKSTLQEVNLLNAKLLFSNKLFKGNNLSESQKMKVIETFDRASNLREVKLVYSTLAESFTGKSVSKKGLTEGFASRKSNSTAPKGQIVESNGMANRMKRLAGLL